MADKREDRGPAYSMFGLNNPPERQAAPGETPAAQPAAQPGAPQVIYVQGPPPAAAPSAGKGIWVLALAVLALSLASLALLWVQHQQTEQILSKQTDQLTLLTRRMDASDDRYAQLRAQFQVTSEKLGMTQSELARARTLAKGIQEQQKQAVQQLNAAIEKKASATDLNKLQTDSTTKFGNLSSDIQGTKKELQNALAGTKGELTGAIARNHDELVALAHRSDRDYYEFSLPRKHARQKIGAVMVELDHTDTKKNLYSVYLFFDDKRTLRRNEAIDSPLFFYVQGASSALELVVNKVGHNSISGYMSAPKGFFANTPNVLSARPT
jgi:predicted outer membrane protein